MRLIDADALKQQFEGDPFEDFGAGYVLCVIDEAPTLALVCQAKWILCSEQMPEEGQSVLAVVDGNVREAEYSYDAFSGSGFYRDAHGIEWWMPMPEPPKEGEGK